MTIILALAAAAGAATSATSLHAAQADPGPPPSAYEDLLTDAPPGKAQTGVDAYPGAWLDVPASAQEMELGYPQNRPGRAPAVYALRYLVTNGDYRQVADFYRSFAAPGVPVSDTGTRDLPRSVVLLAPGDDVKQQIEVAQEDPADCSVTDPSGGVPRSCVSIRIVSRGAASWAQYRGGPGGAPTTDRCGAKKVTRGVASGLGAAVGMLSRGYSAQQAVAQGVSSGEVDARATDCK